MKNSVLFIILSIFVFSSCGSGGSGVSTNAATVTLVPADNSANVAVSATVTATFSAAVTEPSSWASSLTLKKDNVGSSLCTGVTYSSLTATCAHSDLEASTSYTVSITGIKDSTGQAISDTTATFTTAGYTPVGGTVTLSGALSAASTNISKNLAKAVDVSNYKVLILGNSTGEQKTATVASDGTFSLTAIGGSSYTVNFLNSENMYIGTLETGTVTSNQVSVGLVTGADGTTTSLGTITANTSTGKIVSDQSITTDSNQLAYATDGVIAGGKTGEGSSDYSSTVGLSCTLKDVDCPDYDHDGVPDIFDSDNDNNTYADEVDNQLDLCVPGDVKLYVVNYPTTPSASQSNFPTQEEVDADIQHNTMYQIRLEFTPGTGFSMSDINEIAVTAPSYIDSYGYVYNVANSDACFNMLWSDCNGKKLRVTDSEPSKYQIALADKDLQGRILASMFPGDTFILNVSLNSGTTYTCTKKINIIPKYYAYNLKYNGSLVDTDVTPTWATPIPISWTVPSRGPSGMTYAVYMSPYSDCTTFNASSYTLVSSGQDATSATINVESLPASSVNKWSMQLWATDDIGDQSWAGPVNFQTAASGCSQ